MDVEPTAPIVLDVSFDESPIAFEVAVNESPIVDMTWSPKESSSLVPSVLLFPSESLYPTGVVA